MLHLNMKWESYYLEKRGHPRSASSALESSDIIDIDDNDYGDEDDIEEGMCLPCSI